VGLAKPICVVGSTLPVGRNVRSGSFSDLDEGIYDVRFTWIVLQKSKVAGLKIFRENTKQRAIVDSYDLNRATKVACEFCARP
jgi:hypothetical protein